jgi:hypothetical protein
MTQMHHSSGSPNAPEMPRMPHEVMREPSMRTSQARCLRGQNGDSRDMIRRVLKNLRARKQVECLGRGQNAQWRRTDKWELGNTQ